MSYKNRQINFYIMILETKRITLKTKIKQKIIERPKSTKYINRGL